MSDAGGRERREVPRKSTPAAANSKLRKQFRRAVATAGKGTDPAAACERRTGGRTPACIEGAMQSPQLTRAKAVPVAYGWRGSVGARLVDEFCEVWPPAA